MLSVVQSYVTFRRSKSVVLCAVGQSIQNVIVELGWTRLSRSDPECGKLTALFSPDYTIMGIFFERWPITLGIPFPDDVPIAHGAASMGSFGRPLGLLSIAPPSPGYLCVHRFD